MIEMTVGERRFSMDGDEVVRKLRGVKPGRIKNHAVKVEDVYHPIKEAFHTITGIDVADFNTNQARSAFKKLGFEVVRISH
jgi:hypothetical protein